MVVVGAAVVVVVVGSVASVDGLAAALVDSVVPGDVESVDAVDGVGRVGRVLVGGPKDGVGPGGLDIVGGANDGVGGRNDGPTSLGPCLPGLQRL